MKIKVSKETKRSARQEWHRRFVWFPKKVNLAGEGAHFVWLETIEARYSRTMKKWVYRDPANDYSNVVAFDLSKNDARGATPRPLKESASA